MTIQYVQHINRYTIWIIYGFIAIYLCIGTALSLPSIPTRWPDLPWPLLMNYLATIALYIIGSLICITALLMLRYRLCQPTPLIAMLILAMLCLFLNLYLALFMLIAIAFNQRHNLHAYEHYLAERQSSEHTT